MDAKIKMALETACQKLAPAWSLENSIAVNPYLGLLHQDFQEAAFSLKRRAGIDMSMSLDFYLAQYEEGQIIAADIERALQANNRPESSAEFLAQAKFLALTASNYELYELYTLGDLAREHGTKDWSRFMVDRVSQWAAHFFNQHDKPYAEGIDLFEIWREEAMINRAPELMGLPNFRNYVKGLSANYQEALEQNIKVLALKGPSLEPYLHSLLLKLKGWSSYVAGQDWQAKLYGGNTQNLESFLTILLTWEAALLEGLNDLKLYKAWEQRKADLAILELKAAFPGSESLESRLLLQDAFDYAAQRELKERLNHKAKETQAQRPKAQAVFCIDVRSELYRRNLEQVDPEIETLGFAGFFGVPLQYKELASDKARNQCPALIPSAVEVREIGRDLRQTEQKRSLKLSRLQIAKSWKRFKSGKVSAFAFVSPLGLSFLSKLISDSFGWTRPAADPNATDPDRDLDLSGIPFESQVQMAQGALKAMGLSKGFAPMVMIVGHGASTVNNPHATALDCGACGGHSGEINAWTSARLLNDPRVRAALKEEGISLPADTIFIAALHDTTTDSIHIINRREIDKKRWKELSELEEQLEHATELARRERALRFGIQEKDAQTEIVKRSKDWSQLRPEWGLAGCNAFVIAPRSKTKGKNLSARSFLHSYQWQEDKDFAILEAIMTAPMVVTSWINLQYYASTTDNQNFGAGNKTLHNVSGGIGVLEGSAGDLRIGLAWQSVHDGKQFQHLPQRLNVVIDAPQEAINKILQKHPMLQELFDHQWLKLFRMNEAGQMADEYQGKMQWQSLEAISTQKQNENLVTV
ncbi:YbcC family protein [Croceimicrobium hydrocarbonivorans]|uniref:Probable inorganic carbon transporter subunit DabA n=1 Tax=Croceimicrobium hydrocarbonivorans TaxID=2761580 RepID=A0A7H0VFU6_9FLAO|nr:DUF2309 domain-containing protein [Croceimicrobium hydrocarbonivorans]QNR24594.1 DUF2309 domain-containing protein [Croceimicrobium hydrocarbonivorans]